MRAASWVLPSPSGSTALESGEKLVGARVHGEAALGARLPAGDADREERRARRGPPELGGAAAADQETCRLGAVPLDERRVGRMGPRRPASVRVEDVDALQHAAA
jgi:hypothetical protein